jgi:N-acyl-D-aspartate/D-glutamate deacylase
MDACWSVSIVSGLYEPASWYVRGFNLSASHAQQRGSERWGYTGNVVPAGSIVTAQREEASLAMSFYPSPSQQFSSTLRQRPSINESLITLIKSKIATPKDPKAFRRVPNIRCAMKAGTPELGTL